ncbi:MAG: hypothetical protein COX48_01905 [bacterium (Candidatus Stahlbacteria) CG23_combo_of_CG06-09_8_20_14_all_34_7]|nr:MAG: hypothetical protein COX48_01905 [bacterium (Candidatus Stahlbacteria) CG23_combo_of_CG06-09_8_20_14_all_34_7]
MESSNLIQLRENILDKLKKLETMKSQIRDIVYIKIKEEYTVQLKNLNEKLKEEKDYLEGEISKLKKQEQDILKKTESINIQVEELNVRFTLNEFTEDEYAKKKIEIEQIMKNLTVEIKNLNDKRHSYEEIVGKENRTYDKVPGKEEIAPASKTKNEKTENIVLPVKEEEPATVNNNSSQPIEIRSFDTIIPETAFIPPEEFASTSAKEMTIEEKIPDVKESPLDNIISNDIVKEEIFSLGEDVAKEEKLVKENPLETTNGQKDNDLSEFAKMLDNQITPIVDDSPQESIEGLTCPNCGHVNKSDLFNCEKCGAELL